jgi:CheY-like chemotaxis protein
VKVRGRGIHNEGVAKMSKNILVVDDDPSNLKFVSHVLRKDGHEVTEAKDGVEAIELIGNSRFDLVVSDIHMPRLDGVGLAIHLRSRTSIPIILMTAVPFELTQTLELPCLSKPFSMDDLRAEIQRVLFER